MDINIYGQLEQIFRDNFDNEELVITESTSALDIEDWDSIEMINIITLIEESYGFKFNIQELTRISSARNVKEMADVIAEKIRI